MQNTYRRTWAEIDLDAIAHNFMEIKKLANTRVCCVIKADAYGHGAIVLARQYEQLGVDFFAVSNINEAMQLRHADINTPILVLGYTPPDCAALLARHSLSQCVHSFAYGTSLAAAATAEHVTIKIHIKVDTGMSRLGFYYQEPPRDTAAIGEIRQVCALDPLIPEGIFTHFAVADEGQDAFTQKQIDNFASLLTALADIPFALKHTANSGATMDFPSARLDMVRAGIILYGLTPSPDIRFPLNLKPALSLKSVVSQVKTVQAGTDISYGRDFTATEVMSIATIPIGYADGYTRVLAQNGASVLIHGKHCPIVGRVCMDQLLVDLGSLQGVTMGDIVTVIGKDGENEITVDQIAALRGTINYEVICDIGARVPRVYLKNGRLYGTLNYIGL